MLSTGSFIAPDWPAPARVRAISTTRVGGAGQGAFSGFNLATHVGDDPARVEANRALLKRTLSLPQEPRWLEQVHGTQALRWPDAPCNTADASWSTTVGEVCVVMTADCLPVLFCDIEGQCVAAAHAGWRGLVDGVLETTVASLPVPASRLLAWLGPAIGPRAFEVGDEVRARFVHAQPGAARHFAAGIAPGKFMADLVGLARDRLQALGIARIDGGHWCTHGDAARFFSFRRDAICGRMASLIWLQP